MTQATPKAPEKALAKVQHVDVNLPVKSVNNFMEFMKQPAMVAMLKKALVKHLTYNRLISMVTIAISRTPRLRECTPLSLLQGCLDAALCGCVSIGGPGARGYMIPYKNGQLSRQAGCTVYEAQFQSSYLGLCDMARRSKEIAFIDAFPVFRGDRFEYSQGFESKLVHVPNPDPKADRSKDALIYVYAIARYRAHSLPQFRVLTMAEVEEHRARSRAANDGPWVTDYIPMALKTAVRVLAKWLPQTPEMQDQLSREADVEFVDANVVELPDLEAGESRTENLAARLGAGPESAPGEVIDQDSGEVTPAEAGWTDHAKVMRDKHPHAPVSPADPATQAEAARQVQALRDATLPEPQEAPADFDDGHDFNTK